MPSTALSSTAQAIDIATRVYDLRDPELTPLSGGYQNEVWRVASGTRDEVVLRRCSPPQDHRFRRRVRSEHDQLWEQRYQRMLAEAGLPVPRPLPTSDGAWCHHDEASAWWSLSEYRPGSTPAPGDCEAMLNLMDVLAELHRVGMGIDVDLGPRPLLGELFSLAEWIGDCDQLAGRSLESCLHEIESSTAEAGEYVHAYRQRLDHIRLLLDELRQAAADPALVDCPRIPIHSDFWTLNIAFAGSRVAAIYDFDDSHRDLRIHDLAGTLSRCCQLPTGGIDQILAAAMLTRYHRSCPLSDAEYRHLPVAIVAKECWYLLPGLAMQVEDRSADRRLHLGMRINPALWHLANHAQWRRITEGG